MSELFPASSNKNHFKVAFGVINRQSPATALMSYVGNIKAYYKKFAADGTLTYELLASHACTDADLSSFSATEHKDNAATLEKIKGQMQCLDDDLIQIQGDSDTETSQALSIQFAFCNADLGERCFPIDTAKTRLGNSQVAMLINQREISSISASGAELRSYSRLFWAPIVQSTGTEQTFKLSVEDISIDGVLENSNLVSI